MPIKRKNHIVTRGYLTGWRSTDAHGFVGLWYFDLTSRSVRFSPGLKASFAVSKDIYAPVYIDGNRDDRFENWLAESESSLCDFARAYSAKSVRRLKRSAIEEALASIVSSGYRSAFSIKSVEEEMQRKSPHISPEEIRLKVLNNVYTGAQDRISFFKSGTILILRNVTLPLMTNDQPFWDMTPQREDFPVGVFALSPNCLMLFAPGIEPVAGRFQIIVKDAAGHEGMAKFAQLASMRMARDWVACSSKTQAEETARYLTDETIAEARSTDKLRVLELTDVRDLFKV